MKNFEHLKPSTIKEAVDYLTKHGKGVSLIAGGTDLITCMKEGLKAPTHIIDLKTIPGLAHIREEGDEVRIGALTLLSDMEDSSLIKERYPGLTQAAHLVASHQIRNMGTLGGNLCQEIECWYYRKPRFVCYRKEGEQCFAFDGEDKFGAIFAVAGSEKCWAGFPSDLAPMLIALDAKLTLVGPSGERALPLEDFYHELGNKLEPGEVMTEIRVPAPQTGLKSTYIKFRLAKGTGFAIVGVAAALIYKNNLCVQSRIVLGSVASIPWRATKAEEVLQGKRVDEKVAGEAADAVVNESKPLKKNAYKEPITRALIKRAILATT